MAGMRLCPPARIRASAPYFLRASKAARSESARTYSKAAGNIALFLMSHGAAGQGAGHDRTRGGSQVLQERLIWPATRMAVVLGSPNAKAGGLAPAFLGHSVFL